MAGINFSVKNGLLSGDQIYQEMEVIHGTTRTAIPPKKALLPIRQLLIDWIAFLEGEGDNPIPGEAGLDALKISMACLKSASSNNWVEV